MVMDNNAVVANGGVPASPFSVDLASEFIKENLPAEKRAELAMVAQNRRIDLAQDVAKRTIRLQASSADMEQTLQRAHELADQKADFVITSTHETASGRTEITVRRYPPTVLILVCAAILLIVVLMMR